MSNLYLENVELSNFRVYGDSFRLTLPQGPGVTVISGPNGIGKTTLFDAIEWCLTGRISRFQSHLSNGRRRQIDHLTRFGTPEGGHRVTLQFSECEPIDRGLGIDPAQQDVVKFLKQQSWPEIGDLYLYLSITHFLGQSAAQRFSVKSPKDQWEALRGPAGVDRINYIRDKIGSQATRQAFTRAIKYATEALERAQDDLREWEELITERNRMRQLSAAADTMGPSAVLDLCSSLAREAQAFDSDFSWVQDEAVEPTLARLGKAVSKSGERLRADLSRLDSLAHTPAEFESNRAEIKSVISLQSDAENSLNETVGVVESLNVHKTAADSELEAVQTRVSDANSRLSLLARLSAAATEASSATDRLVMLDREIASSDVAIDLAEARCLTLSAEISQVVARLERRKNINEALEHAHVRLDLAHRRSLAIAEMESVLEAGDPRLAADALRRERVNLAAETKAIDAAIESFDAQLKAIDDRGNAVAAGVAAIAGRLLPEDTSCPVCGTQFISGELVKLASLTRSMMNSGARELGTTLSERQVEAADLRRRVSDIDAQLVDLDARCLVLERAEAAIDTIRRQLAQFGPREADTNEESSSATRLKELEESVAALDAEIETPPSVDELRVILTSAETEASAEIARRSAHTRTRAEVLAVLETAQATLNQHPELFSGLGYSVDLEPLRGRAARALADAEAEIEPRRAEVEKLRGELEVTRQRVLDETLRRDTLRRRLVFLGERLQQLSAAWLTGRMQGETNALTLARDRDQIAVGIIQLGEINSRLERISEGFRRWLHDEDLAERQRKVVARLQAANIKTEPELSAELQRAVAKALSHLERAQHAKKRADEIGVKLQADADQYAEQVLRPLNATIQRFGRTLMMQADDSIFYRAEHHANRSELKPGIVRNDASGKPTLVELNPNLFFSEGQLSALSVSALLAASTTFRWSRWRALLMDDPLQHNDVIHASAFADLLRQLVKRLDYQIILSTHDATEASFMIRKFESAGISVRLCELYPLGDDGLVTNVA